MKYLTVDISWQKMFSYSELGKHSELKKSFYVYIWLIKVRDKYYPYYVGKTKSLPKRIMQHLAGLMGGTYNVYEMNQFKEFHLHKNEPLYCQIPPERIAQFIGDYVDESDQKIHRHLREMIGNSYFTFAEISNEEAYDDIEKSVIKSIGKHNLVNGQGVAPIKYTHRNQGDEIVMNILERYTNE